MQMPIHLDDLELACEVTGIKSALIVPCYMCPAVSVAVREEKPFLQFFKSSLTSAPFAQYIGKLQSRLKEKGVNTRVFKSLLYHHWFLCMWASARRKKLRKCAEQHEAVIVLGCGSATQTVRDSVRLTGCKVIEGMQVTGIMNAKLRFHLPGSVSFEECKTTPLA
jgi:hypothetical protein